MASVIDGPSLRELRRRYDEIQAQKRKDEEAAAQSEASTSVDVDSLVAPSESQHQSSSVIPPESDSTISISPTHDESSADANVDRVQSLGVSQLQPGVYQPRRKMDSRALTELADSIKQDGVIQPILVRPLSEPGRFEIVAGERRWRASKVAGLERIPAIIRSLSDVETMRIALVENIQRADLNAIEEATAIDRLMVEFKVTQKEAAVMIGKSVAHVSRMLTLMSFTTDATKEKLISGELKHTNQDVLDEIQEAKEKASGKKRKQTRIQKVSVPEDFFVAVTKHLVKVHKLKFKMNDETTIDEMVEVIEQAMSK